MKHLHPIIYSSHRLPYIGWQAFEKSIVMPTSMGIKLSKKSPLFIYLFPLYPLGIHIYPAGI
jgi:hypothetical protein